LQGFQGISARRDKDGKFSKFIHGEAKGGRLVFLGDVSSDEEEQEMPLVLAEGAATAAAVCRSTGFETWWCISARQVELWAKEARRLFPERAILAAADNDAANERNGKGNAGRKAAEAANKAAGAIIVMCPAIDGGNTDFCDLYRRRGADAVREVFEQALAREKAPIVGPGSEVNAASCVPEGYVITGGRLFRKTAADDLEDLGAALHATAFARDERGQNWSLLLTWESLDGKPVEYIMPRSTLCEKSGGLESQLLSRGYEMTPEGAKFLGDFLMKARPEGRVTLIDRPGWHGDRFALGSEIVGGDGTGEKFRMAGGFDDGIFSSRGSWGAWQERVLPYVRGNSRLVFGLTVSFAAPFLGFERCMIDGGLFHFFGSSSTGKSTLLKLAASVWGIPDLAGGFIVPWRMTANGLEGVAESRSCVLLALDEIGQASPKDVYHAAYMLSNSQGKVRARSNGDMRKPKRWRTLGLSSGELSFVQFVRSGGLRERAGQDVRFLDIPADAGKGLGVLDRVVEGLTAKDHVANLLAAISQNYGVCRELLEWLSQKKTELEACMPKQIKLFTGQLIDGRKLDPQAHRVAERFAVCAWAGDIVDRHFNLRLQPAESVRICFDAWLEARGGAGSGEEKAILAAVREYLHEFGERRFHSLKDDDDRFHDIRVGWREPVRGDGETFGKMHYFVTWPAMLKHVCPGYEQKQVGEVLARAGWLRLPGDGKRVVVKRIPGEGLVR
ncbi:MAG: DUF927 domain-containing protein, partial [Deltaproteobacteria bacterium]|nr:DUF927 domain-containing protein [Deltaproteobacteria bacterium]